MSANFDNCTKKLIIYTGNVLNLSEIKKKVGQTLTEEVLFVCCFYYVSCNSLIHGIYFILFKVLDCIRIVLAQWKCSTENVPTGEKVEVGNFCVLFFV
jgi:hypothetical protein